MSALTGKGADKLLPAALSMYARWNQRVPTSKLNRWIEQVSGYVGDRKGTEVGWCGCGWRAGAGAHSRTPLMLAG